MKKKILIVALILAATVMMGAKYIPHKLVRLTLVNKSGMDIEVSLTGTCDNDYYLRVPEGDRAQPTEKTFTIVPDEYQMSAYFVELWDPVYGATCDDRQSTVTVQGNTRVVIFECTITPPNAGEWPKIKLGGPTHRNRPQ